MKQKEISSKVGRCSQCDLILDYLKNHDCMTPNDAIREFACHRLAARIYDLKRSGYHIENISKAVRTIDGKKPNYGIYILGSYDISHGNIILSDDRTKSKRLEVSIVALNNLLSESH